MKKGGGLLSIELSPPPKGKESGEVEMEDEADGEAGDMEAAKLDAARAVLAAMKKGDAQALSDALEEHKAACEAAYGEEG